MTELRPSFKVSLSGEKLILKGGWSPEAREHLLSGRYRSLVLGPGLWTDLTPLVAAEGKVTNLVVGSEQVDWKALSELQWLEMLEIGGWFNTDLNFSAFCRLRYLKTYWNPGYGDDIFTLPNLEVLILRGWSGSNGPPLSRLKNLRYVELLECKKMASLGLVGAVPSLRGLLVYGAAKLVDIEGVRSLGALEYLEFDGCKGISNYAPIAGAGRLEDLTIAASANIASLDWLGALVNLRRFAFGTGTRVSDGNLLPLLDLPQLRVCRFNKSSDYNLTPGELEKRLLERNGMAEDAAWKKPRLQI